MENCDMLYTSDITMWHGSTNMKKWTELVSIIGEWFSQS